ncbi:ATP-binding cassette subfamily B protein [Filimonas zeae]|uniref:ABC transporter ATP-binding protein n=1 Tax=Filimonas zeae TaxID=1737353 RepID=A0A917MYW6_9BACT|nr:ABC transporter ATP-binding protein [Filimonas zeae]MDR6341926.1 ATP-binding cassette subfamily B protein [Filimonas zeae]GGH79794.1 ABC transporter ATP-binding protein [Filimonas zeae]
MRTLLLYLRPYKWLVFWALLLATINQTFSLLDPLIFGKIIDRFARHPHTTEEKGGLIRDQSSYIHGVIILLLASMGVAMVSRIAKAFQDYVVNVVIQKFGAKIFTDGLKHSLKLPFQDFEDQRSGETLSILTKVRTDTEKFITSFINVFFGIVVGVVFVTVYAFSIHWSIIPTYFAGILLLSWLTSLLSRKIKVIQKTIVNETTALAGSTTESLRNIELVKSLGLSEQEISRLNNNTFKILGLELKKVKSIRTISFIQGTFVNTLRQVILFLLLYLVFRDKVSVGQLFTMQLYSFFIFGPLQEIGNIIMSYREAEASLNNFHTLMQRPVEPKPTVPTPVGSIETLAFESVSFKHQTANYKAIDNISFHASKGETIAFVGPSGSGKSTLVKLLVGLYVPQTGKLLYNNTDSHDIYFDALREQIGFVTQDTQLFAGTIRENLLFVKPSASDEHLTDVLNKASCGPLLQRAEKGLETMLGEGGLKLSGGEKQRLSIARSLLRNPRLLIFDEATSALDSITEEEITSTIKEISAKKEQITVLIAHRLSTIMHADRIYVLEKGQVAETGTHESLLQEKGLYYAMWRQQIGERK